MMDMEYNRTSPFISNCLHYSSEFHPYVGEFAYLWAFLSRQNPMVHNFRKNTEQFLP